VLSSAMEEYLKSIYIIEKEKKVARVSDIGNAMSVRKASVVSAVNRLMKCGLVSHERYGYISLSDKGRELAEAVHKKHTALLAFLRDFLKVDEEAAKKEACAMEHALSDDTVKKLMVFVAADRAAPVKQLRKAKTGKPKSKKKK